MGNIHKPSDFPEADIPQSAYKMNKELNISEI